MSKQRRGYNRDESKEFSSFPDALRLVGSVPRRGLKEREEAEKGGDIRDFLASYIRLLDYLYKGHLGFLNTRARA